MIPQETISLLLGYTSIGFWLCAQLPQIIVNWRRKSVEGLAFPFLANWFLGDSTNLLGCILTNQLPFQTYLATYFVFVDSCLVIQYFYYNIDARRMHVDLSAEGVISSASSIIIAPPPSLPQGHPRTSSRTRASSVILDDNAAMFNVSPARRRAKSMDMDLQGISEATARAHVRSSSSNRGGSQYGVTSRSRSRAGWDGDRTTFDSIDEERLENAQEQGDDSDAESHMITSFYSEGGGLIHRPSTGMHVSWGQNNNENQVKIATGSVSRDRGDQSTVARYRQRSRSNTGGFTSAVPNIMEETILDNRGRPTTPRSARLAEEDDGGYGNEGEPYPYTDNQPFPSFSTSTAASGLAPLHDEHQTHSGHYHQSSRTSGASTSTSTEGTSRRTTSVVFLGVLVLLGFSTANNTISMSSPSTWRGNVLTSSIPSSLGSHIHQQSHHHYYHHPYHHAYQPNFHVFTNTHHPRNTLPLSVEPLSVEHNSSSDENPTQMLVGRLAAWTCTSLYLTSRLPQIWKNYTRKSVQGLSMYLFAFAFLGNLFYVLSILTSPNMNKSPPEESRKFLQESIPYLLGSAGTLLFDVTIVFQSFIYDGDDSDGHGNADRDRERKRRVRSRTRTLSSGVMSNPSASAGGGGSTSRRYGYGWTTGRGKGKGSSRVVNDEERRLLEADETV